MCRLFIGQKFRKKITPTPRPFTLHLKTPTLAMFAQKARRGPDTAVQEPENDRERGNESNLPLVLSSVARGSECAEEMCFLHDLYTGAGTTLEVCILHELSSAQVLNVFGIFGQ